MSKTIKEKTLDTPAARARLKPRGKPYYRAIDAGLHLGYRRGLAGGHWVMRHYLGNEKYRGETFAIADDHSSADGIGILDFFQAQRRARELAGASISPRGPLTVAEALSAYFDRLEQEGSKSLYDARGRARRHICPSLGEVLVADLTRDMLAKWLANVAGRTAKRKVGPEATRAPSVGEPCPDHSASCAQSGLPRRQGNG